MLLVSAGFFARAASTADSAPPIEAFLGRWDLTLQAPDREYPSWMEITRAKGRVQVRMVGRWGHARELPSAEIANGRIRFVSPKEEEGGKFTDMIFDGKLSGQALVGTGSGPDGTLWTWHGEKAPPLKRLRAPQWAAPIEMFNGKDLSGWTLSDPSAAAPWLVKDRTLVSPGGGPDLITTATFADFKLHIEFNCAPKANSGVYLRGRYEVQIEDDSEPEGPSERTGAVYGFLAPSPQPPRSSGQWQAYDITLIGRTVTVVLNRRTIIDHREIPGITGGALDSHEAQPGPIYLQGSEAGHVAFRNVVVTPARDSGAKPTIVIVHGAWGGAWAFRQVAALLTAQGYHVYRPQLTGGGERVHLARPDIGLGTHIEDVVNTILYEDLHDIILVGHSYGGMVITGVADRIPDRIRRLVYLDAFLPNDGESMMSLLGTRRDWLQAMIRDDYVVPSWVKPDQAPPHDVPQSLKTFTDPIVLKNKAARDLPATYILTVDRGAAAADDDFFAQSQRAQERGWPVLQLTADHNAQWSAPQALAEMLAHVQ